MSLPEVSFVDIPLGPQSLLQRLSGSAKRWEALGGDWFMVFDVVFEIIEKAQPIYAALYQETKAFVFSWTST